MSVPEKCVDCIHHKVSGGGLDYCNYIEHENGYVETPVPYPYFYRQEYPCKGYLLIRFNGGEERG